MRTRILLVEDHQVLRDGLRGLIERAEDFEVVAEAGDGVTAVDLCAELRPDLVVMDIWLPRLSGIDATRQILERSPDSRVLMLSQLDSWTSVERAFEAGASGYLVKTSSASQLLVAARAIRNGERYVSPEVGEPGHRTEPPADSPIARLSAREREVLRLIGEGLSSRQIGETLGIAERTVDAHRSSVMNKLDVHKATDLVRLAIREGLINP